MDYERGTSSKSLYTYAEQETIGEKTGSYQAQMLLWVIGKQQDHQMLATPPIQAIEGEISQLAGEQTSLEASYASTLANSQMDASQRAQQAGQLADLYEKRANRIQALETERSGYIAVVQTNLPGLRSLLIWHIKDLGFIGAREADIDFDRLPENLSALAANTLEQQLFAHPEYLETRLVGNIVSRKMDVDNALAGLQMIENGIRERHQDQAEEQRLKEIEEIHAKKQELAAQLSIKNIRNLTDEERITCITALDELTAADEPDIDIHRLEAAIQAELAREGITPKKIKLENVSNKYANLKLQIEKFYEQYGGTRVLESAPETSETPLSEDQREGVPQQPQGEAQGSSQEVEVEPVPPKAMTHIDVTWADIFQSRELARDTKFRQSFVNALQALMKDLPEKFADYFNQGKRKSVLSAMQTVALLDVGELQKAILDSRDPRSINVATRILSLVYRLIGDEFIQPASLYYLASSIRTGDYDKQDLLGTVIEEYLEDQATPKDEVELEEAINSDLQRQIFGPELQKQLTLGHYDFVSLHDDALRHVVTSGVYDVREFMDKSDNGAHPEVNYAVVIDKLKTLTSDDLNLMFSDPTTIPSFARILSLAYWAMTHEYVHYSEFYSLVKLIRDQQVPGDWTIQDMFSDDQAREYFPPQEARTAQQVVPDHGNDEKEQSDRYYYDHPDEFMLERIRLIDEKALAMHKQGGILDVPRVMKSNMADKYLGELKTSTLKRLMKQTKYAPHNEHREGHYDLSLLDMIRLSYAKLALDLGKGMKGYQMEEAITEQLLNAVLATYLKEHPRQGVR